MSLLFDALKRAQGNGADISSSGSTVAPGKLRTKPIPYLIAGIILLAGGFSWLIYQQKQSANTPPPQPSVSQQQPAAATQAAVQPALQPVASQVLAASGVAPVTNGADTQVKKTWPHPVTPKKPQQRSNKPAVVTETDPLKEGYLALSDGRLDQAEQSYLAALAQRPHEKDALLGLAVIAQRNKQMGRAADLYRQVLHEDIGNAAAAAGLVSLSELADPVAAESQLRELLDIKPSAPELHYALGGVLARQLRWGEAQQAFFHAYSLAPGNALYAYNLAVSLDHLHQDSAAIPFYEQALRQAKPADPILDSKAIERRIQELKSSR